MPGMADTLTRERGPLPTWAWFGLGTAGLVGYMMYRKKQQANAAAAQQNTQGVSSNLGTTPISNLTIGAEPMPIQMGDTFVNVPPDNTTVNTPVTVNNPPGATGPAGPPGPTGKPGAPGLPGKPAPPAASLPPAPKPAPPKTTTQQKTVTTCAWPSWCGSLWGIAQHEYGNGALWPQIYNANKAKIGANPNLIHSGVVLVIPAA